MTLSLVMMVEVVVISGVSVSSWTQVTCYVNKDLPATDAGLTTSIVHKRSLFGEEIQSGQALNIPS